MYSQFENVLVYGSQKKLENPFPPTSTTVPDSTNGLCHPSRAFGQAFNHLQPTRLLSTNLKPEPDRDKQTASFFSSPVRPENHPPRRSRWPHASGPPQLWLRESISLMAFPGLIFPEFLADF
ncbi:hypothetical protein CROQUDRAFT_98668 [Cronartium quercuum f. sp. fusiforme G11]|uniref:Uncharacterized protein n=1 Tax=Cronartium quercuum f. sp. fusiforme G11 TaxID=708437 RepID=A0A9P6N9J5_9BASI|nr:hypothetical protein CROQUDRAFT_98668 [Cronartium quercuum f. sp. fusiforme G11]